MDVVDGFLFLVILLQIIAFLIGVVLLSVVYAVISRTKNRMVHLLLPPLVMGAGFLFLMPNDAPMLLVGALIFVVPMAVLIPPFVFSNRFGEKIRFTRILICDLMVSVVGVFLPYLLVSSRLSMIPAIFWHTPLSNGLIYGGLIALNVGLATGFYQFFVWRDGVSRKKSEEND